MELTEISILATKKSSGKVSLPIKVRQHEQAHDAEGSPLSFTSTSAWFIGADTKTRSWCQYSHVFNRLTYNVR